SSCLAHMSRCLRKEQRARRKRSTRLICVDRRPARAGGSGSLRRSPALGTLRMLAVRGESTNGRVASAGGPYARLGGAGDGGAYRRAAATKTQTDVCRLWRQRRLGQTAPRPGRGRARGAVPRSRVRRNPKGAWVLLGSAIVRWARVARPRMLGSAIVRWAKVARPRMLGSAIVRWA